jgi:long-chain acyl-CoA synthetase
MLSVKENNRLSIRRFFAGKHVLLTGSTGFLAKAVVEKLLWDLPDVGQIYLLIRPRFKADGTRIEPRDRLHEEVLRNSAFGRLRERHGEGFDAFCESKITCVSGDLTKPLFGLEPAAYTALAGKLQVVINSAATVVFDERLDLALTLNTEGPLQLLQLARDAKGVFVQVSTAYVSGKRTGLVPERLMPPMEAIDAQLPPGEPRPERFDVREEVRYLRQLSDQVRTQCEAEILGQGLDPKSEEAKEKLNTALIAVGMNRAQQFGWNDTYTFTKFLGEQLIKQEHGEVSTLIVRPSIIESSLREPEPGWLDGLRMADPIIIGYGKGRLPDFPASLSVVLDVIPADLVVNSILAGATHIARQPGAFDLFTVASSAKNPLRFQNLYDHVRDYFIKHPFTDKTGRPIQVAEWKFPTIPQFREMLQRRYIRPAKLATRIINGPIPIPGSRKWRPRLKSTINRVEQLIYYVDIYGPYVNLDCRFEIDHALEVLESVDPAERAAFDFDPRKFHWRHYLQDIHIPGLKRNILRMDVLPRTGAGQGKLLEEEDGKKARRGTVSGVRGAPQTIVDLAFRGAERHGDKPFLEIRRTLPQGGHDHVRITYRQLWERADLLAHKISARVDLHSGDRVVIMGENCPEWALAYLAVSRAGATAVPLDRTLPAREAIRITRLVEAKAVIMTPGLWKTLGPEFVGTGLPVVLDPLRDLEPYPGCAWPLPQADPSGRLIREPTAESLASLLFTSGTTLEPKGVMLTHGNFISNTMSVSEVIESLESDRFLSVLPLHHAFEFTCGFLIPMYGGATIYNLEALRGQEVLNTMKLNEVTVVLGVPRLFKLFKDGIQAQIQSAGWRGQALLRGGNLAASVAESFGGQNARRRIFAKVHDAFGGNVRVFISGGAALDPETFQFFRRFGITICEGYGLTETAPVLCVNPLAAAKAGSVGPAVPGTEINIENLDGEEVGEILARGPSVMHGYWRNPEATAKVFDQGWFRTGDIGRFDHDGYLHITGRLKDLIVTSAGKKVHPDEIEHLLKDIKGVRELCVLGLPDRSGHGEAVSAVVVPEPDADRPAIMAAIAHLTRHLSGYQHVSRVEFQTEELPKTSTLKLQRGKIRDRFAGNSPRTGAEESVPLLSSLAASKPVSQDNPEIEVARVVARVANISAADVEAHQKLQMDLGIDSIGKVDVLQHLEARYGVTFAGETEARLFTVRDVVSVVEEALKERVSTKVKRGGRSLWDRATVDSTAILAGMRLTPTRNFSRQVFEAITGVIMSTHLRVRGVGVENIPRQGPYILTVNHSSHLDLPAVRKVLGRQADHLHAMAAKDYFFNTRFKSWFFLTFLNALPLDREVNPLESLAVCKTVLDNGRPILIFPEGTRTLSGELQPFKPGIGVLAIELSVPIVPVYVSGTFAALPKGKRLPRSERILVRIGKPMDFRALKAEKGKSSSADLYRRATAQLRASVVELSEMEPED